MRTITWLSVVCVGMVLTGCQEQRGNEGPISRVDKGDADAMNAEWSKFEHAGDPPLQAQTHFAAGQLAESQGANPQAIRQYKEAIKLDPRHTQSWYHLGVVYTRQKMYPEAVAAWEQYIAVSGALVGGYNNLALCLEQAGRFDEAEGAYRKGLDADAKNENLRVNYGLMLARRGRPEQALEQFQAVLKPAEAHYDLATVYEQQGEITKAKMEYRRALELDPKLRDAKSKLAGMK